MRALDTKFEVAKVTTGYEVNEKIVYEGFIEVDFIEEDLKHFSRTVRVTQQAGRST